MFRDRQLTRRRSRVVFILAWEPPAAKGKIASLVITTRALQERIAQLEPERVCVMPSCRVSVPREKDCKYEHDKKAFAVVKSSVKAAAAPSKDSPSDTPRNSDPKPAPKPKPKAKASAVALVVHSDDD